MTVRRIGNATIAKVEEICGPGFRPNRMFPRFDQEAFDAQKGWMLPDHIEAGSDRLVGSVHTWIVKTGRHTILIDKDCRYACPADDAEEELRRHKHHICDCRNLGEKALERRLDEVHLATS